MICEQLDFINIEKRKYLRNSTTLNITVNIKSVFTLSHKDFKTSYSKITTQWIKQNNFTKS